MNRRTKINKIVRCIKVYTNLEQCIGYPSCLFCWKWKYCHSLRKIIQHSQYMCIYYVPVSRPWNRRDRPNKIHSNMVVPWTRDRNWMELRFCCFNFVCNLLTFITSRYLQKLGNKINYSYLYSCKSFHYSIISFFNSQISWCGQDHVMLTCSFLESAYLTNWIKNIYYIIIIIIIYNN